jgi:hypothetical protein
LGKHRIHLPELFARDAGIEELGLLRVDLALLDLPLGDAIDFLAFGGGQLLGPDHEIVVRIERRVFALVQHLERRWDGFRDTRQTQSRQKRSWIKLMGFWKALSGRIAK